MSNVHFLRPGDPSTLLTADRRQRERDRLAAGRPVDVLVIGGGITGTGVALDAASRGLSVALIEAHDLAFGTSRWSSKLIHGGLRYLASGQLGVAWESAVERAVIATRIAPHLVHPLANLIPVFADTKRSDELLNVTGLRAGDALRRATGVRRSFLPAPQHLTATEAIEQVPALAGTELKSAHIGWDGQLEDDARLVTAVARTAAAFDASILTRIRAVELGPGGATVEDLQDGGQFTIRATTVVNATGVWAGELDRRVQLSPSRGSHVILPASILGNPTAALTVPVPGTIGRFVFALPQANGLLYVGLTDVAVPGEIPAVPSAPIEDVQWILSVLNTALATPVTTDDVVGTYAGLRPLISTSGAESSADISRRHLVVGESGDVITVTGGKLTTYRRMASDAVDRITDVRCRTRDIALVGAGPASARADVPVELIRRYGNEARLVADLAPSDTPTGLLHAQFAWAVQAEGAMRTSDLLDRRTRIGLINEQRSRYEPLAAAVLEAPNTVRHQLTV